jgi:hypothetical protein
VEEDFGRDFAGKGEDGINDSIQLVLDGLLVILERFQTQFELENRRVDLSEASAEARID